MCNNTFFNEHSHWNYHKVTAIFKVKNFSNRNYGNKQASKSRVKLQNLRKRTCDKINDRPVVWHNLTSLKELSGSEIDMMELRDGKKEKKKKRSVICK